MAGSNPEDRVGKSPEDELVTDGEGVIAVAMLDLVKSHQEDPDIISFHDPEVEQTEHSFDGQIVTIHCAPEGKLISPLLGEDGQQRYNPASGDNLYTHFIEFGAVLGSQDMIGTVAADKRWDSSQTPLGIEIDRFDSEVTSEASMEDMLSFATARIEALDPAYGLLGWLDPILCQEYALQESAIRDVWNETIRQAEVGVALLRAGGASLELAGYDADKTALLQAKRHNMTGIPENIGIGLNIDSQTIEMIGEASSIELAERAIASGSSLLALLMVLEKAEVLPDDIRITGIGATQQGLDLMNKFLDNFLEGTNKEYSIRIAKLFYALSGGEHPYYIQTLKGSYAVLDGGDFADLLLSPEQRTVWNNPFTPEMIQELKDKTGVTQNQLDGLIIKIGEIVSLEQAIELRNICVANEGVDTRFRVGEILTGVTYKNTNE